MAMLDTSILVVLLFTLAALVFELSRAYVAFRRLSERVARLEARAFPDTEDII
jgi:hypothetical protein